MSVNWEDFIDNLKDDAGKLAKNELKNLVNNAKNDNDVFIKKQGEKMERYFIQLALGQITKSQFEGYILDIKNLTEMQKLKMTVAAKASAQRITDGISNHIINGVLTLIKV